MRPNELPEFHQLAEYYDALNDHKDYRAETRRLEAIARKLGPTGRTSWLDVACGTGRHLAFLKRRHAVEGVDASPEMLRIARRRVPGVRLRRGDMRTFDLHRRFDVVSCLFSAIGHLRTKADVRTAYANFARHLRDGGVLIVEPWIQPSAFRTGMLHLRTHERPDLAIVRLAFSARRGNRSMIHYHFLIGEPGRGVRHFAHVSEGLLLSPEEHFELMRSAGLSRVSLDPGFLRDRGLLVAVRTAGT